MIIKERTQCLLETLIQLRTLRLFLICYFNLCSCSYFFFFFPFHILSRFISLESFTGSGGSNPTPVPRQSMLFFFCFQYHFKLFTCQVYPCGIFPFSYAFLYVFIINVTFAVCFMILRGSIHLMFFCSVFVSVLMTFFFL